MESAAGGDISYLAELTPHPASKLDGYGFLGVGSIRPHCFVLFRFASQNETKRWGLIKDAKIRCKY